MIEVGCSAETYLGLQHMHVKIPFALQLRADCCETTAFKSK